MQRHKPSFAHRLLLTLISTAFAAVVLFGPGRACADQDPETEMARQRFSEGVAFFDQGEYDKARAAFRQAYALKPHPAVLLNLAQSELNSGHLTDAATHFAQFLREHEGANPAESAAAREGLATAKSKLQELVVHADVPGATIIVDGERVGDAPLSGPLYLEPGEHRLVAEHQGESGETTLVARAGSSSEITLRLGSGAETASTLEETTDFDSAEEESISTEPTDDTVFDSSQTRGRKSFFPWLAGTPLAWVTSFMAVGGAVGGFVYASLASDRYDSADEVAMAIATHAMEERISTSGLCTAPPMSSPSYEDYKRNCALYQNRVDDGDDFKTLSTISFVVGGVGLAGTIVYYFVDSGPETESVASVKSQRNAKIDLLPVAAPGYQGLQLSGRF